MRVAGASGMSSATRPNATRRRTRLDRIVTGEKSKAALIEADKRSVRAAFRRRWAAGVYEPLPPKYRKEQKQVTLKRRRWEPSLNVRLILRLPLDVMLEVNGTRTNPLLSVC